MGIIGNVINSSCQKKKEYSTDWPDIHMQCIDPKIFYWLKEMGIGLLLQEFETKNSRQSP